MPAVADISESSISVLELGSVAPALLRLVNRAEIRSDKEGSSLLLASHSLSLMIIGTST